MTEKQRAFGRSLSDFPDLSDTEKKVIAAAREGRFAHFGDKIPETDEEKKIRTIRAGLVRFLALGGDNLAPVHESGVRIRGVEIDGELDLRGCTLAGDLVLLRCVLTDVLQLLGAHTNSINLGGSHCQGIRAERTEFSGPLFMNDGFVATGPVRLNAAKIVGALVCSDGRFEGRDDFGRALDCDGTEVGGYAFFRRATFSQGAVNLLGMKISSNLECDGARLKGRDYAGNSLVCDGCEVGRVVFFTDGFSARGSVRMIGANIGGDVACFGGNYGATESAAEISGQQDTEFADEERVIILARATISGTLWLSGLSQKTSVFGGVDLSGAKIGRVVDALTEKSNDSNSKSVDGNHGPRFLHLDGLIYERFGEPTDLAVNARLAFLRLQHEDDLGKDFKPQPWIQMVKVLRDSGHVDTARKVAIEYEHQKRSAGVIERGPAWVLHCLYGLLVGYGHRPLRLFMITLCVWFTCGVVYQFAAINGWMAPT